MVDTSEMFRRIYHDFHGFIEICKLGVLYWTMKYMPVFIFVVLWNIILMVLVLQCIANAQLFASLITLCMIIIADSFMFYEYGLAEHHPLNDNEQKKQQ
jgi:hypothetical protein